MHVKDAFEADTIWDIIYSKKHSNGFEPTWQKATHLTTSQGELLKTEDYSFNFIFNSPWDDDYFEFLYEKLPYLLLYMSQVLFECFNIIHPINNKTISYNILTAMGAYEALFLDGRSKSVRSMIQSTLARAISFGTNILCPVTLKQLKRYGILHPKTKDAIYDPLGCIFRTD